METIEKQIVKELTKQNKILKKNYKERPNDLLKQMLKVNEMKLKRFKNKK